MEVVGGLVGRVEGIEGVGSVARTCDAQSGMGKECAG